VKEPYRADCPTY